MSDYPKVTAVVPREGKKLEVTFNNGARKLYDCSSLFASIPFSPLENRGLFDSVKVDPGGYGVSWNDDFDVSEAELWLNGA